jgi:DNA-binding transcriptional regulator YhcF (GntR family)
MSKQLKLFQLVETSKNLNLIITKKIESEVQFSEASILFSEFSEKFQECLSFGFSKSELIEAIRCYSSEEEKTNVLNNTIRIVNIRSTQSAN